MALGTVVLGSAAIISAASNTGTEASPSAGTYAPVSDINSLSKNSTRNVSSFGVFGRSVAYSIPGTRDQTLSLGGFLSVGDTGQGTLFAAEAANTTAYIKVLFDGTNGFTQAVKVGSRTYTATPDGLQQITFALSSAADPTITGTGPLL
ncbi:MAG: hypothetical protein ABI119_06040 [Gemmatimonadaceae bacterium]